ncbi:MAG: hypothetical protein MRERV_55c003 [Mycoplasmataceae bacterium RV_VA103A]|nr:MAG: hypothetical protein MRERV_55c003 [Mycoplasmataceae bacterium RV_VA103A]
MAEKNIKLPELISKNKEVKTILQELDTQLKNSCQKTGCPDSCRQIPTSPQRVLTQLKIMENQDQWEDEINDPDFKWADYKQDLQSELLELGEKYPVYQEQLKSFARELNNKNLWLVG